MAGWTIALLALLPWLSAGCHGLDLAPGSLRCTGSCPQGYVCLDGRCYPEGYRLNEAGPDRDLTAKDARPDTRPDTRADAPRADLRPDTIADRPRPDAPQLPPLLARWPFEEGPGATQATDVVRKIPALLPASGVSWEAGYASKHALGFIVSSGPRVTAASTELDSLPSFTFAAWIRPASEGGGGYGLLVGKGGDGQTCSRRFLINGKHVGPWGLELTVNRATANASAQAAVNTVSSNVWQHVAATFSPPDGPRLYLNGLEVTYQSRSVGSGTPAADNATPLGIGGYPIASTTNGAFDGRIDDLRIYAVALNAAEIAALHASTK